MDKKQTFKTGSAGTNSPYYNADGSINRQNVLKAGRGPLSDSSVAKMEAQRQARVGKTLGTGAQGVSRMKKVAKKKAPATSNNTAKKAPASSSGGTKVGKIKPRVKTPTASAPSISQSRPAQVKKKIY